MRRPETQRTVPDQERRCFAYLLGFHQHLEEHGKTPGGQKQLLLPTALSVTGGAPEVPVMLLAHLLHGHLKRRGGTSSSNPGNDAKEVVPHLEREGVWGGETHFPGARGGRRRERVEQPGWLTAGRTHPMVRPHCPDAREGLPQHQLDREGLEACSKGTQGSHAAPPTLGRQSALPSREAGGRQPPPRGGGAALRCAEEPSARSRAGPAAAAC